MDVSQKSDENLVDIVRKKVRKHFKRNIPIAYKFHRYPYFKKVVKVAKEMADYYELSEDETEILLIANWFRFTGITQKHKDYQSISAAFAETFLSKKNYPESKIEKIKSLILSTKSDATIDGQLAKITHDAAYAYIGKKSFFSKVNLLRVEMEEIDKKIIKNKAWEEYQFKMLTNVHFHTQYANEKYRNTQAKNIQKQRKVLQKATTAAVRKKTGKDFGRGIDTLYRTTYRNHINLSSIADGKANMMISINTIILSAIITLFSASLTLSGEYSIPQFQYSIPVLILLVFVLISAIFAILSARPKVTQFSISTEDILTRSKSVLFFGNFISLDKNDFVENMNLLKRNQSLLYDNMAVDMYYLGHVLDRKYRLLKFSYNIFMLGLILCVITFLCVVLYLQLKGA